MYSLNKQNIFSWNYLIDKLDDYLIENSEEYFPS